MVTMLIIIPLFAGLGGQEVIIILFLILLLFGGKKIPEMMKGLGKGVKSFKDGMNEVDEKVHSAREIIEGKSEKSEGSGSLD